MCGVLDPQTFFRTINVYVYPMLYRTLGEGRMMYIVIRELGVVYLSELVESPKLSSLWSISI